MTFLAIVILMKMIMIIVLLIIILIKIFITLYLLLALSLYLPIALFRFIMVQQMNVVEKPFIMLISTINLSMEYCFLVVLLPIS